MWLAGHWLNHGYVSSFSFKKVIGRRRLYLCFQLICGVSQLREDDRLVIRRRHQ